MPETRYVLSNWGGGTRGIIQARGLQHIEKRTGRKIHEIFSLIAGTSTGSIVGAAAAVGIPMWDAVNIFRRESANIFPRRRWHHHAARLWRPLYPSHGLDRALERNFGSKTMGDCKTDFLSTAVELVDASFTTYKSWKHRGEMIRDVVRRSTAAPTYLEASIDGYVDGGLAANAPGYCALVEARKRFPDAEIRMLSLGCGYRPSWVNVGRARRSGLLWWGLGGVDFVMHSNIRKDEYFAADALGEDAFTSIQPIIPESLSAAMDVSTPEQLEGLIHLADEATIPQIDQWLVREGLAATV